MVLFWPSPQIVGGRLGHANIPARRDAAVAMLWIAKERALIRLRTSVTVEAELDGEHRSPLAVTRPTFELGRFA